LGILQPSYENEASSHEIGCRIVDVLKAVEKIESQCLKRKICEQKLAPIIQALKPTHFGATIFSRGRDGRPANK